MNENGDFNVEPFMKFMYPDEDFKGQKEHMYNCFNVKKENPCEKANDFFHCALKVYMSNKKRYSKPRISYYHVQ